MATLPPATAPFTPLNAFVVRTSFFYQADTLKTIKEKDSYERCAQDKGQLQLPELKSKFNNVMRNRLNQVEICVEALKCAEKFDRARELFNMMIKVAATYTDEDMMDSVAPDAENDIPHIHDTFAKKLPTGDVNQWKTVLESWNKHSSLEKQARMFSNQYKKKYHTIILSKIRIQLITLLLDMYHNLLPYMSGSMRANDFVTLHGVLSDFQSHSFAKQFKHKTDTAKLTAFLTSVHKQKDFEFTRDSHTEFVCTNQVRLWDRHIGLSSKVGGEPGMVSGNSDGDNLVINVFKESNIHEMLIPFADDTAKNKQSIDDMSNPSYVEGKHTYRKFEFDFDGATVRSLFNPNKNDLVERNKSQGVLSREIRKKIQNIDRIVLCIMPPELRIKFALASKAYFQVKIFFNDSGYSDTYFCVVNLTKHDRVQFTVCDGLDSDGEKVLMEDVYKHVVKNP
jgi:hypothetical protein